MSLSEKLADLRAERSRACDGEPAGTAAAKAQSAYIGELSRRIERLCTIGETLDDIEARLTAERDAIGETSNAWHQGARAGFARALDIVREANS